MGPFTFHSENAGERSFFLGHRYSFPSQSFPNHPRRRPYPRFLNCIFDLAIFVEDEDHGRDAHVTLDRSENSGDQAFGPLCVSSVLLAKVLVECLFFNGNTKSVGSQ
jgi:hypothetical protein